MHTHTHARTHARIHPSAGAVLKLSYGCIPLVHRSRLDRNTLALNTSNNLVQSVPYATCITPQPRHMRYTCFALRVSLVCVRVRGNREIIERRSMSNPCVCVDARQARCALDVPSHPVQRPSTDAVFFAPPFSVFIPTTPCLANSTSKVSRPTYRRGHTPACTQSIFPVCIFLPSV